MSTNIDDSKQDKLDVLKATENSLDNKVNSDVNNNVELLDTDNSENDKSKIDISENSDINVSKNNDENSSINNSEELSKNQIAEEDVLDYDSFTKSELVESIEQLVEQDVVEVKRKISLVKLSFIKCLKEENESKLDDFVKSGGDPTTFIREEDDFEKRFNAAFSKYKEKKNKFNEELELEKNNNLKKKNEILEDLKKLIESEEELKITYDAFKKLQLEWKEVGQVPRKETNNLWQNYHFLVEKFLDKVRINEELRDLDRKKNLEACIDLCEKAEELLLNPKINESFKLLQKYHQEWKEIGVLPSDKKNEVWERFKLASDKVIERRKAFYENLRVEQENNYAAKVVLCEKIEETVNRKLSSIREWNDATKTLSDVQDLWKTIGPAPQKMNDEIWKRFRAAINVFYDNKKEYFDTIKDEQTNNYNLKLDICTQAEAVKDSQDWKKTTIFLIKLQNDWKAVGPVPKKYSDEIWKRFRAACDHFFNNKATYFSNIGSIEQENLLAKQQIINKIIEIKIEGEKKDVLDSLNILQRDFVAIGHVPIKEKEKLNKLFRDAVNEILDKLKINPAEKKIIGFKSKFENLKNDPASRDVIRNEVKFVTSKLNQLKSDIQLWENNIGFFANSKSADILKQEFETKISNAKEEVQVLEQKLQFLKAN